MTPQAAISALDRALSINGETITLRRTTVPSLIPLDVKVTANVAGYQPQELISGSGIVQGDAKVILSVTEMKRRQWVWPPKVNDKCVVDGKVKTVLAVNPFNMNDTLVRIELQVRG